MILRGDALDLILAEQGEFDLIAADPPYAFGGSGDEHALSATVAVVLREAAQRLKRGRWMLVMCASSWRSMSYMVECVRGVVTPVRVGTWCKPEARTKVATGGWAWTSVKVIAFRKGKAENCGEAVGLDHITAAPIMNGRRAQLPFEVAQWMVAPFAVAGGRFLDPFAGSGMLVQAAAERNMEAIGFEKGAAAPAAQETRDPLNGGGTSLPTSGVRAASVNDTAGKTGAAANGAESDKPASPPFRKAKFLPCGGARCREQGMKIVHDASTCPQYAGRRSA